MTKKQKRFVEEYLIDLNATQAAIRAGYSPATAGEIGSENLKKPELRARIDAEMAKLSKRTGVNAERVVRELAKIAFIKATDLIDPKTAEIRTDATEDDMACVAAVKVKNLDIGTEREVRMCDKLKALELLGKHFGMFTDKVDLNAPLKIVINDDYGEDNGE